MKRFLLLPLVFFLGCEGIGNFYNAMPPVSQAVIMAVVAITFAITAKFVVPKRVYFAQTE